jgi:hypothetical protein
MTAKFFTKQSHRKFIPVLAKGSWTEAALSWLIGSRHIDLSGRIAPWLCAVLILELCTGFASAQQTLIPEQSPTPTLQASASGTPKPQQSETATVTPRKSQSPTPTPQEAETPAPKQSDAALHSPADVEKEILNVLKHESADSKKEKRREFPILVLTLVFTFIGVIITLVGVAGGLFALVFTGITILDAQKQAGENAAIFRAQFSILLRQVFTAYDDLHTNFRPGGPWHGPDKYPPLADWARIELYMGLFEHCDRLLKEGLIDEQEFAAAYGYRLKNLLTNDWVVKVKLESIRPGWKGFINLCYRLPEVREKLEELKKEKKEKGDELKVVKLTDEEYSDLYPKRKEADSDSPPLRPWAAQLKSWLKYFTYTGTPRPGDQRPERE